MKKGKTFLNSNYKHFISELQPTIKDKKIYLVNIIQDYVGDYSEMTIFATLDKTKAELWVERFNHIITSNQKRIDEFDFDNNKIEPFWWWYIRYNSPMGRIREVKLRY